MQILAIILGVTLGIILFLGILALILYTKVKLAMRQMGFKVNSVKDMASELERIKREESTKPRSISGITTLLLPNIRKDFPDFNEQELYNKAELVLRKVFSAIEKKDGEEVSSLPLLKDSILRIIEDYKSSNLSEKFDDIRFHKFTLSEYEKKDGMATITVSVALEYYYQMKKGEEVLKEFMKYKKQTSYQCKFIYVYDENKVDESARVLAVNCPNCGAVIKALGHKQCEYCGTAVKEINLKSWECSSYIEK